MREVDLFVFGNIDIFNGPHYLVPAPFLFSDSRAYVEIRAEDVALPLDLLSQK
jgi:hypothetical protein